MSLWTIQRGEFRTLSEGIQGSKTGNERRLSFEEWGEGISLYKLSDIQTCKFQG